MNVCINSFKSKSVTNQKSTLRLKKFITKLDKLWMGFKSNDFLKDKLRFKMT